MSDSSADAPLVTVETPARGVALVTLQRPERRNAMSTALLEQLMAVYEHVLDVDDVGCVVITGADPSFCAGMDLSELGQSGSSLRLDFAGPLHATSTPTIAAVNGPAITGGLELVLACDIVVASEHATFADTHARVGVLPGAGMSVLLPAAIGLRRATELSLTGRHMGAHEAHAAGLVNHVTAHDDLVPTAVALAERIAGNDRTAVRAINRELKDHARMSVGDALASEKTRFVDFLRHGLDPAAIEERRSDVIASGRSDRDATDD